MPILKANPALKDFQEYVKALEIERGFNQETIIQKCLLLGEEVGELFKAVRKDRQVTKVDPASNFAAIDTELADIIILLCTIANRLDIDLEQAFRAKEELNKTRKWE